jgi:hypothetical protein
MRYLELGPTIDCFAVYNQATFIIFSFETYSLKKSHGATKIKTLNRGLIRYTRFEDQLTRDDNIDSESQNFLPPSLHEIISEIGFNHRFLCCLLSSDFIFTESADTQFWKESRCLDKRTPYSESSLFPKAG